VPGCTVQEWRRVRDYLQQCRPVLTLAAAGRYPVSRRVAGTSLLAGPSWIPAGPTDLDAVRLDRVASRASPASASWDRAAWDRAAWDCAAAAVLPRRADGSRYRSYSAAVADLAPPALMENRPTYRLARARLAGPGPFLAFGAGTYFDSLDAGAACAHEYAALSLGLLNRARLRALAGAPWDLGRRPANLAIATLALRVDRGGATFPLHWRDPRRVGHAGGLYHVLPTGIFQAAGDDPGSQAADFDLWGCMQREFAEELAGAPEVRGPARPGGHRGGPLGQRLSLARAAGRVRPWVLGLGVDPLSLATDLLTAVAFDAPVFDDLFGAVVDRNDEGRVLAGVPFTAEAVSRLAGREPMQAAGAALLRLAWRHRRVLLG
jgi:hypothetical protein